MTICIAISLPLQQPVYVLTILIVTILLAPVIFRLIRIPDIAAYLIAGIIIGPYGFHILDRDTGIVLLGTIGLLYIMFLAGLDLNMKDFKKSKKASILFGLLTFLFPFIIGFTVSKYIFMLNIRATLLVAIMFSSHTLVAYPIARKLGIIKDVSVLSAIGGTIITDTLVLLILSILTGLTKDNSIMRDIVKLGIAFALYVMVIFYSYPRISKWYFENMKRDRYSHYLLLLSLVCLSASIAKIIGVEPIIGAFIAGLALNKVVPKNSMLFQHIEFVGNILFIPLFLFSIGMLIDLRILFHGIYLWFVAFVLIVGALTGKWLASFVTQKIVAYSRPQRIVLFGLTSSHAAATIAVILIGYQKNIINSTIFNAAILIILITSLVATLITEWGGRKLAGQRNILQLTGRKREERILVPIANPDTMVELIQIALRMNVSETEEPIYALSVVKDDNEAGEKLASIRQNLGQSFDAYNIISEKIKLITRIDLNIVNGIIRAAKELFITDVIIGWGTKSSTAQRLFGNVFDHLIKNNLTLYVCCLNRTFTKIGEINIFLYRNTELEAAFSGCISKISRLFTIKEKKVCFYTNTISTQNAINSFSVSVKRSRYTQTQLLQNVSEFESVLNDQPENILNIIFLGRKHYISFDLAYEKVISNYTFRNGNKNFILVIPGLE
ncbi:MAG: cation:proton antiporter [Bacteroidales bacterium]|nr:cation:proton antiporter [Bacteroidales bacterium]